MSTHFGAHIGDVFYYFIKILLERCSVCLWRSFGETVVVLKPFVLVLVRCNWFSSVITSWAAPRSLLFQMRLFWVLCTLPTVLNKGNATSKKQQSRWNAFSRRPALCCKQNIGYIPLVTRTYVKINIRGVLLTTRARISIAGGPEEMKVLRKRDHAFF